MKGFVPTPPHLVDLMVEKLFRGRRPRPDEHLLDPGCGTGAFIEGVNRWCAIRGTQPPQIVGVESDPRLLLEARSNLRGLEHVKLLDADFLSKRHGHLFDYIVGNPPYVPITALTVEERVQYRGTFSAAVGRFDLYLLFFEQALHHLALDGRLVFVTPEKFLYTQTARPLRLQLGMFDVEEIHFVSENVFGELITYPAITTVVKRSRRGRTAVTLRDGSIRQAMLSGGKSWLPGLHGIETQTSTRSARDAFLRISCGVATGADGVFVIKSTELTESLKKFAHPTVSGRSLRESEFAVASQSMLVPYSRSGVLLQEHELGELGEFLQEPVRKAKLMGRTCVARKPWYSFHENPPLSDILAPKILCKDIGSRPWFVVDEKGAIVPRHSVYYMVPKQTERIHELCRYLNSRASGDWLLANCQRAANGYVRLQSHVLRQLPLPDALIPELDEMPFPPYREDSPVRNDWVRETPRRRFRGNVKRFVR
ncbi:MAG: N-6 DNA methylase [Candidatus Latescibacteria bacterium]|nr:N-6 DNA methylase [Candidatus Latescibacterota bacterium]